MANTLRNGGGRRLHAGRSYLNGGKACLPCTLYRAPCDLPQDREFHFREKVGRGGGHALAGRLPPDAAVTQAAATCSAFSSGALAHHAGLRGVDGRRSLSTTGVVWGSICSISSEPGGMAPIFLPNPAYVGFERLALRCARHGRCSARLRTKCSGERVRRARGSSLGSLFAPTTKRSDGSLA